MDIHPIFVHFPIAMLTVYSILELIWSKRLRSKEGFVFTKIALLIFGLIGAFLSLASGDNAAHAYRNIQYRPLVEVHEGFASFTTTIFVIIAIVYLVHITNEKYGQRIRGFLKDKKAMLMLWTLLSKISNYTLNSFIVYILAIIGLLGITMTGTLGGILVYGKDVDPIANLVYSMIA